MLRLFSVLAATVLFCAVLSVPTVAAPALTGAKVLPPPGVSPTDSPWGAAARRAMTFSPPRGAVDVNGYKFGFSSDLPGGAWMQPSNQTKRTLRTSVTPPGVGDFTLYVWARDAVAGVSAPRVVRFTRVAVSTKIAQYRFDEVSDGLLRDEEGRSDLPAGTVTLTDRATYDDGTLTDAMATFDGSGTAGGSFKGLAIDRSFLISALIDPAAQTGTVLAFGGRDADRVRLGVVPDGAGVRYRFSMWDTATSAWVSVSSAATDSLDDDLRFVMAVHDQVAGRLRIVTGAPGSWSSATSAATVTPPASVSAPRLTLGGARSGRSSSLWSGHLDDLSIYQTAGSSATPSSLYSEACLYRVWTDPLDGRCQA